MSFFGLFKKTSKTKESAKSEPTEPELTFDDIIQDAHFEEVLSAEDFTFLKNIVQQWLDDEKLSQSLFAYCGFAFENAKELQADFENLTENTKPNYRLVPLGRDGSGGMYAVADNHKIAYIDEYVSNGFIADNIKDFFSIIVNCQFIGWYTGTSFLKNEETFIERIRQTENDCGDIKESDTIQKFIKTNQLESSLPAIYKKLRHVATTKSKSVLESTLEGDYEFETLLPIEERIKSNEK